MAKSPDAFRTISEVADWLDTPAHVLRFWESKFSQIKPVKRAGGRRYYRPNDMLLIGGIKKLLHDDGMTIKGAQKLLRQEGIAHVISLSQPLEYDDPSPKASPEKTVSPQIDSIEAEPEDAEIISFSRDDDEKGIASKDIDSADKTDLKSEDNKPQAEPDKHEIPDNISTQADSKNSDSSKTVQEAEPAKGEKGTKVSESAPQPNEFEQSDTSKPADIKTRLIETNENKENTFSEPETAPADATQENAEPTDALRPLVIHVTDPIDDDITVSPATLSRMAKAQTIEASQIELLNALRDRLAAHIDAMNSARKNH